MIEDKKIGQVILDYRFYNPELHYSDGEIEKVLLHAAAENQMEELLYSSNDWAVLYHCSDIRENLLEWYPFKKESKLLEIGSGCGALTGLFSRKVASVTCLELSERRSLINAYRHKDCDNIKIMLGNFQNIRIDEKFDYITLIGVWEYAGYYINGKEPYLKMLKGLKQYLKDDGKLLIAIENKMGLKYWNGAPEDHTGLIYGGLNDYVDKGDARTFSKQEIEMMLVAAGWKQWKFYYPMPDYKLPDTIYTDDKLPEPGELRNYRKDYNASRVYNFYDAVVSDQLCADGMVAYFANSFLVECGSETTDVIFAKCNRIRNEQFRTLTIIREKEGLRFVQKGALNSQAQRHICQAGIKNKDYGLDVHVLEGCIQDGVYVTDYIFGQGLDVYLYPYRNDKEEFIRKIREIIQNYLMPDKECMIDFCMTEDYRLIFGEKYIEGAKCLKVTNIDMIFSNLRMTKEGEVFCIDDEWVFAFPVPYEFVLWKALSDLYSKYMIYLKKRISREQFFKEFDMDEKNIKVYEHMNRTFYNNVIGKDYTENYQKPSMTYNLRFT